MNLPAEFLFLLLLPHIKIMKKKFLFPVIILVFILSSCSRPVKERIIGQWQLNKVGQETVSPSEISSTIEFFKEGKLIIVVDGKTSVSKWELRNDEKAIQLVNENNEKVNWNIIALSNHQFVYTRGNDTTKMTYTK